MFTNKKLGDVFNKRASYKRPAVLKMEQITSTEASDADLSASLKRPVPIDGMSESPISISAHNSNQLYFSTR